MLVFVGLDVAAAVAAAVAAVGVDIVGVAAVVAAVAAVDVEVVGVVGVAAVVDVGVEAGVAVAVAEKK